MRPDSRLLEISETYAAARVEGASFIICFRDFSSSAWLTLIHGTLLRLAEMTKQDAIHCSAHSIGETTIAMLSRLKDYTNKLSILLLSFQEAPHEFALRPDSRLLEISETCAAARVEGASFIICFRDFSSSEWLTLIYGTLLRLAEMTKQDAIHCSAHSIGETTIAMLSRLKDYTNKLSIGVPIW